VRNERPTALRREQELLIVARALETRVSGRDCSMASLAQKRSSFDGEIVVEVEGSHGEI